MRIGLRLAALCAVAVTTSVPASAETIVRWGQQGDALTLDPHAQNEGPTTTLLDHIYEYLIDRDNDLVKIPGLAVDWQLNDDTTWEFKLREGVTFHNGSPLTADDVVFSINRARAETSDFRGYTSSIADVIAVDDYTVRIVTDGPDPILTDWLTGVYIMDREWAEEHGVEQPQDFAAGEETFAVRNANGTGPYRLVAREPDVRTVLERNPDYWGAADFPDMIDTLILTPIASAPTRVAALLSGELDFVLDPAIQDLPRLDQAPDVSLQQTNEVRSIFLGWDTASPDSPWDDVEGRNPLADPRVRQALYQGIDVDAIQRVVMRGLSVPAGMVTSPGVFGYSEDLDARLPFDQDAARQALAEAGYPEGFRITLHCPNDRYVNDEAICQAVVGMLGQVGIEVDLQARPKSIHFAELQNRNTGFYMLGWGVPTYDSEYVFRFLFHTPDGSRGSWNFTGYSDPRVDELTEAMQTELDQTARAAMIREAWEIVNGDVVYLPLHHQVITWATRDGLEVPMRANNRPRFTYARYAQ